VCNRDVRGVILVKYRVLIAIQRWRVFVCEHPSSLPVPVVSATNIPETKRFLWMTELLNYVAHCLFPKLLYFLVVRSAVVVM
jgi:hypothetical protein